MLLFNVRSFILKKVTISLLLLMSVWLSPVLADDSVSFYITRADHYYYSGLYWWPEDLDNPWLEIEKLTSALSKNSNDIKAYYNRAIIKRHIGDTKGAHEDFLHTLHLRPTTSGEYADSCLVKWRLRALSAFKDCEQAVEAYPQEWRA